jgi:YHS domain-containing protein
MKITINHCRIALALITSVVTAVTFTNVSVAQEQMMTKGHGSMTHDAAMNKSDTMMKKADVMTVKVGLSGYCPVCVVEHKKWEKGSASIESTFDGVVYRFPSEAIKAVFEANPQKYVPALNGDCIVCYEKHGKRVPGSVQHAAIHNNRMYLFPSDKEKQVFIADAAAYDNSDLALNGECIVCLAKVNKHVPGVAEHTVVHNGLRYLFPSAGEASLFRQSPDQFVSNVSMMKDDAEMMKGEPTMKKVGMKKVGVKKVSMKPTSNGVRLVGRSGCAACEFGVTPISDPNQLGLAIVANDGRITVVEDAHRNYPTIYKDRFEGKQLAVEGKIVKTEGKISWLEPSSVKVIN